MMPRPRAKFIKRPTVDIIIEVRLIFIKNPLSKSTNSPFVALNVCTPLKAKMPVYLYLVGNLK